MTEEGKATGISIWLSPARDSDFFKSSSQIIGKSGGPVFDPHITLLHLAKATEKDIEEVVAKIKQLAAGINPFSVKFNGTKTGSTFFRSIFLEAEKSAHLSEVFQKAENQFANFVEKQAEYYPHLSLFYGKHSEELVNKIKPDASSIEHAEISITRIDLFLTEGKADEWIHLGSCQLGSHTSGLFFRSALLINNKWTNPSTKSYLPVTNPATRQTIHFFPAGNSEDIDKAVHAASHAFRTWGSTTGAERAPYLRKIASKIREKKEDLARTETLDNGKPLDEALNDMDDSANCFDYYAKQAEELDKKQDQVVKIGDENYSSRVRYEPVGVAGMIIPWNYPLLMAAWKLGPCLATGCTGILKPSELTPLSALELGAIIKEVLPPGILNIVTGLGPDAGSPLSNHPNVDKVAFTGSVATGSKVMTSSAQSIKKVSLELGGKSPLIVFDDVELEQAIEWIMFGIFFNQGQVCSATSRVLIQETIYNKVIDRLVQEAKKIKIGDGLESETKLGPVVSEGQYNKIIGYINKGVEEGAKLLTGGVPTAEVLLKGYFIEPTIFTNVPETSTIWREEIFGPVLCVRVFKTEEEAIEIANNSQYGLAAAVISKDRKRGDRVARALRAGIVWVNCSQPTFVEAPWGGMKRSGTGRELGPWGMDNYLEVKQITSYEDESGLGYSWYIKK